MPTLTQWLETLGLAQYAQVFAHHEVGIDAVRLLDDVDLRELGLPLGPRKILLRAIAELNAQPVPAPAPSADAAPAAERRQITVMFCDLVGSTALSQALDPEDLRELMRRYQDAARAVITRYDGHVAQYLGDGVMVYFGWPRGHGDDARRALHAALDLRAAVGRLETQPPLAVRTGIATGLVVIGQTGDGDASSPRAAVGETPNLAARLQALAAPDQIVIAALTRRLAGETFACDDLGPHALKGITEPVQVFAVTGPAAVVGEAAQLPAQLVGREQELGLLRGAWQHARDGRGQLVLLSGEPGIGKSALASTLFAQLREQGAAQVAVHCSAFHTGSALFPLIDLVQRVIGWLAGDTAEANLARLEARLARDGMAAEAFVPSMAALLELPLPAGRYAPLDTTPQMLRRRILDQLVEWLIGAAERAPLALLWEDLHWADPSSLEFAQRLAEQLPTAPLLLVATARPGFQPPWAPLSHVVTIPLHRLDGEHIAAVVQRLAGGKALPAAVLDHIVRKTDGVPLFVEEMTRALLDTGTLHEGAGGWELKATLAGQSVPATLHESLMLRLDRTPQGREVAQIGAVLGREFSDDMLRALGLVDSGMLDAGLAQLLADELLYRRGLGPRAAYVFKHALIRDAAYESLLKRRRQQIHLRVAQCIAQRSPQVAEQQPELLALHYAGAGLAFEAAELGLKAAGLAAHRAAYGEAQAQVDVAMNLLERQADSPECRLLRARLQLQRAAVLGAIHGAQATTTAAAFMEARRLCERLDTDTTEFFQAMSWICAHHYVRGELQQGVELAIQALRRARSTGNRTHLLIMHRVAGSIRMTHGDILRGAGHLRRCLRLYELPRDGTPIYVPDPRVTALCNLAWLLVTLGYPSQGLATSDEAQRRAAALNDPYLTATAGTTVCLTKMMLLDYEGAFETARESLAHCQKYGIHMYRQYAQQLSSLCSVELGRIEAGAAALEQIAKGQDQSAARLGRVMFIAGLARAVALSGQWPRATILFEEALHEYDTFGPDLWEADVRRAQGEFFLQRDGLAAGSAAAEACFQQSLAVARRQGTRWFELRTAVSLARLWHAQGRTHEARSLLAPLYGGFTEGFDTPDLKAARALLDEMQGA